MTKLVKSGEHANRQIVLVPSGCEAAITGAQANRARMRPWIDSTGREIETDRAGNVGGEFSLRLQRKCPARRLLSGIAVGAPGPACTFDEARECRFELSKQRLELPPRQSVFVIIEQGI